MANPKPREGEILIHKRYGKVKVLEIIPRDEEFRGGVLLSLFTNKGITRFNKDRTIGPRFVQGHDRDTLKRCLEQDYSNLMVRNHHNK